MSDRMIDEAQVRHIAKLARLRLSDDEIARFSGQLADIVAYVQQLAEVNTADIEPLAHPLPLTNVMRDDEPHQPFDSATALANAPQREGSFFKVPAVLDPGGGGA